MTDRPAAHRLRPARLILSIGREIGPAVCLLHLAVNAVGLLAPLLFALGLRPLVDGAEQHRTWPVLGGAALTGSALLLSVLAPLGYRWATIRMRERQTMVMQRRLLALTAGAPRLEHLERPAFRDRLELLKRSAPDLLEGMTLAVLGPLTAAQLLLTAVLLAQFRPVLLLVPLVALPAAWLNRRAESVRRAAELRTAEQRRTAQHLFELVTAASSGKDLRVHGLRAELLGRHRRAVDEVRRGSERAVAISVAAQAGGWLLFAAAFTGAVLLVLREAAAGRASAGDVALTLGLAAAVVSAAGQAANLVGSALRVRGAAEHYRWLERQAAVGAEGERPAPSARLERGIELEGVSFGYGGGDDGALSLDELDLRLPAGAVVAVVGENGAGKTTLVKLLSGMYAPTRGRVLLDGVDLAEVDQPAYRRQLTAGFQDFMRFELPVRESVGLGDLAAADEKQAVVGALDLAGADFVAGLPQGVEQPLGPRWEQGVDLSGGQWQALAMARSMMRQAPLLAVFDEPGASLDPHAEHALFEQVAAQARRGGAQGRITLLISHRFSTVRMADLIVVLERGRVLEQGTHRELMARHGRYAELYGMQARAYR